jgi:ABC-type nitrate/sulfonate/bicarbonate transport system substrate-binding protein
MAGAVRAQGEDAMSCDALPLGSSIGRRCSVANAMQKVRTARRAIVSWVLASVAAIPSLASIARADPDAGAPALVRVRSASRSLPLMAAISQGFFDDEGLNVDYTQFVSSRPTFIQVDAREIEIIISSMDNAINYQLNPNNPAGRILDNVIIAAHDEGLGLALAAAPSFATVESLRGQRVGVDVPHSGFGLAAEKILLLGGLVAERDYALVSAGTTPARYQGLLDGLWEAAIINAEGIVRARAAGLSVIDVVSNVIQPYQGGVVAANRGWLADNPETAWRFLRGLVRGMDWVFEPANRAASVQLLLDAETSSELAAKIYDLNVGLDGLSPRAALDPNAFRNVLELRNEFGGFESPQDIDRLASEEGGLYDLEPYQRAVESLVEHEGRRCN